MATRPDDYLMFRLGKRMAELWQMQTGGKFTLHLGKGTLEVTPDTDIDELVEADDDNYSPLEITSWTVVEANDGRVYLEEENVAFDLGAGPVTDFTSGYYWVEWEADGYAKTIIAAVELPLPWRFEAAHPKLAFDFRFYFGWLDLEKAITEDGD